MKAAWITTVILVWSQVHAALPFRDSFDTLDAGSLDSQNGWRVLSGRATVQNEIAYSSNAVELASGEIGRNLSGANSSVWLTFRVRCSAWPVEHPSLTNVNTSLAFCINTNGRLTVYSNMTPVELAVQIQTNVWTRFDVYCDYDSQIWNLSINKTNVAAGLPLYSSAHQPVNGLRIQNDTAASVYVDEIAVEDIEPVGDIIDGDNDKLPDWWEQKYFGGIFSADTNSLAANGINRLPEAYVLGINPLLSERFTVSGEPGSGGSLRWTGRPGRRYAVWSTDDLASGFTLLEDDVPWDQNEFVDVIYTNDLTRFYQIRVQIDIP